MTSPIRYLFAALVLMLAAVASAATLPRLLPQDSLLAAGVEGIAAHQDKFQPFIDEWQRLGLTELLTAVLGEEGLTEDAPFTELGVGLLDLLGNEAWITVSASGFNPLPAITVAALLTPRGIEAAQAALEESMGSAQSFTEGNVTFWLLEEGSASGDLGDLALVFAQVDDLVVLSTNPDVMRGVLRRYQGASEAGLQDSAGFSTTIGTLGAGNLYFYLDLPAAARAAAPFANGMGFDSLITRLTAAFNTAGAYGTVSYVTADGLEGRSLRVMGDAGQDPTLYSLIAGPATVSDASIAFVPPTALAFQAGQVDPAGWWRWLGEVLAAAPDLGIDDLDEAVMMNLGVDPQQLLFSWMGGEFATITLSGSGPSQIGVASDNPLGDSAFLLQATNPGAAQAGIAELMTMVSALLGAFTDPMGQGPSGPPATRNVAGVEVTDWSIGAVGSLSTAVAGGYAIFATTPGAMDAVLTARQQGGGLPAAFAQLRARVPGGVRMMSFSDERANLMQTADLLLEQIGMAAGLAGPIDFDATERAGEAARQFATFVAARLGGSVGFAQVDGTRVRSESYTAVAW